MKYYIDHDIEWISIFLIVSKGSIFYLFFLITVIILSKWCIFCRNVYFMLKHMINIEHFYADIYSLLDIIRINKRTFWIDLFIHRDNPLLYLQKMSFFIATCFCIFPFTDEQQISFNEFQAVFSNCISSQNHV